MEFMIIYRRVATISYTLALKEIEVKNFNRNLLQSQETEYYGRVYILFHDIKSLKWHGDYAGTNNIIIYELSTILSSIFFIIHLSFWHGQRGIANQFCY